MEERQTELETNTADNADINQLQARDTRHRRMQEVNRLCTDWRPLRVAYCIVSFHTIQPSSFTLRTTVQRLSYLLIALAVELFQLVSEVVDGLLVTFLEARLGRLMLDRNQLQVLLQLLNLVLSSPTDLALQRHQ